MNGFIITPPPRPARGARAWKARTVRAATLVVVVDVMAMLIAAAIPTSAPARDRDCGDFATQAAAQAYFLARGGPTHDPDRLDADSDGIACESLPCPCSTATGPVPTPVPTSTPTVVQTATPAPTVTPAPTAAPTPSATPGPVASRRWARIVRVVDGDTVRVRLRSGRQLTVRLIGIDTPEIKRPGVAVECGGTRASAHMRRLAFYRGRGRPVTLVGDPSQDAVDRYGRTLAYVDARGKGDLGRLMVRAGWASVYVFEQPFARLARYEAASATAKRRDEGVWGRCGGDFHRSP